MATLYKPDTPSETISPAAASQPRIIAGRVIVGNAVLLLGKELQ